MEKGRGSLKKLAYESPEILMSTEKQKRKQKKKNILRPGERQPELRVFEINNCLPSTQLIQFFEFKC